MLRDRELQDRLEAVGYFPAILVEVIGQALASEVATGFYVQPDVAFGHGTIGQHVSALVLTPTRLVVVHADDHSEDEYGPAAVAVSAESVPLRQIRAATVTHIYDEPSKFTPGLAPQVVRLTVSWGSAAIVDLEPAACTDPDCEADHGYNGSTTAEDISLGVTAGLNGDDAAAQLVEFAGRLSAAAGAA
jgi:hypothetical protein